MELRSLLKSGHSAALGVLALRAVQSALTLAMPTGGDSPPMGWTPIPDPADGGVGSPPFPVRYAGRFGRACNFAITPRRRRHA
jgi:hypothetical protein